MPEMYPIGRWCRRCLLQAEHPLAHLDEQDVCALCRRSQPTAARAPRRQQLLARMEELFAAVRARGGLRVLLAYSGGKDSSWTLVQLRRYGLRVRALTVDNGFLSEAAHANAARLAAAVGAEHVVVRPPLDDLRRLFRRAVEARLFPATALTRASSICNACIAVVKSICLREALAHRMEVVAWGWSPAQAPLSSALLQPSAALLAQLVRQLQAPLLRALGDSASEWLAWPPDAGPPAAPPCLVSPLALLPYNEARILHALQELGWKRPSDVDAHSTNCRLNALAIHEHWLRLGFHPYALETAALVREGLLDPAEARHRLHEPADRRRLAATARELQLGARTLDALGLRDAHSSPSEG